MRANFDIVKKTDKFVLIRDIGPWDRYQTITNDAEGAVKFLLSNGELKVGQKLIYIDSEGDYCELKFNAKGFINFSNFDSEILG